MKKSLGECEECGITFHTISKLSNAVKNGCPNCGEFGMIVPNEDESEKFKSKLKE